MSKQRCLLGPSFAIALVTPLASGQTIFWTEPESSDGSVRKAQAFSDPTEYETLFDRSLWEGSCPFFDDIGRNLYWNDENEVLRRINVDGGPVQALASGWGCHKVALDSDGGYIYRFASAGPSIDRYDLDGVFTGTSIPCNPGVYRLAVDALNSHLYWAARSTDDCLYRAEIDGSNPVSLSCWPSLTGIKRFDFLTSDSLNGYLFWVDGSDGKKLIRSGLDGTNVQVIYAPPTGHTIKSLKVNSAAQQLYWSSGIFNDPNWTSDSWTYRANLDGSGVQAIGWPQDGIYDFTANRVYYRNSSRTINYSPTTGSGVFDLVVGTSQPHGIALDTTNGLMYWGDRDKWHGGGWAKLNGTLPRPMGAWHGVAYDPYTTSSYKLIYTYLGHDNSQGGVVKTTLANGQQLTPQGSLQTITDVTVDGTRSKIFFSESLYSLDGNSSIWTVNTDGSGLTELTHFNSGPPIQGVAVDIYSQKLYWVRGGQIHRSSYTLNGTQTLGCTSSATGAIAFDEVTRLAYWGEADSIWRADADCGNPEPVITGITSPGGIAVIADLNDYRFEKPRFTSLRLPENPNPGAGSDTAIAVTLTALGNGQGPDFSAFEGEVRYVNAYRDGMNQPVFDCPDSSGQTYKCATLGCQPEYLDWESAIGGETLHLSGSAIVPSSTFHASHLSADCSGQESSCMAGAQQVEMRTSAWGDVVFPQAVSIVDVGTLVDKLKGVAGALPEARALIWQQNVSPATRNVTIQDVSAAVDALKGLIYPFGITMCP